MEIHKLNQTEKEKTRLLYEEVFSEDSSAFVDYYYTEKIKDNIIYGAVEDQKLQAMLHLNPYLLSVNGSERRVNYIVAVATREAYRRRGYMAALLKYALKDMYKNGETFTFLMPASENIYLPYDFRTVYEQNRQYYEKKHEEEGYEPLTQAGCQDMADAANKYLSENYQVFAIRDAAYYGRLIKEYGSDGGRLMVRKQEGKITDCRIFMPDDERDKPKIMARILDVRRMLMAVGVKELIAACFCITDPVIEENNRCVVITGTEFSGIMLMDGRPENSEGEITVAALAGFLFGAKTVGEIDMEEGVSMSERLKGELEKIIPLSKIFLNEIV